MSHVAPMISNNAEQNHMNAYQQYLDAFSGFAQIAIHDHKPRPDDKTLPHSIERLQSYVKDLENQKKKLNNILADKANELLAEAMRDSNVDAALLKKDLITIGKEWMGKYIEENKLR